MREDARATGMIVRAMQISRRQWLFASASIAAAQEHAHQAARSPQPPRLEVLDAATAREIEAIASQIIPSGDSPGAREAGVIWFIDRALATFDSDRRDEYRKGMEEVQQKRRSMFPESAAVAALTSDQQIALIRAIETTPFFELLRTHTVLGFLGNPSYGGNQGQVGWKHIGFVNRMVWEPPFGYYDAEKE